MTFAGSVAGCGPRVFSWSWFAPTPAGSTTAPRHSDRGIPRSVATAVQESKPAGGGSSTYPSAGPQNAIITTGSAQSAVIWIFVGMPRP